MGFRVKCQSALLNGIESYSLGWNDYRLFGRALPGKLRAMLRGGKAKNTVHNQWSQQTIYTYSKLVPVELELRMYQFIIAPLALPRRLLQHLARQRAPHAGDIRGRRPAHAEEPRRGVAFSESRLTKPSNSSRRRLLGAAPRGTLERAVVEQLG